MGDVKAGVDAWGAGDYAAAIREWKVPAEKGDPDAQFNLAQAYKLGRGVPQDLAKAEALFEQAAAKGHLQAADNYGLLMFQRGARTKAMPFIEAAAGRGDARAQYILGLAHFNGDIVAKDWVRAYALMSLAQQAGLPQAAGALAQMDQFIALEDRQKSVPLAAELSAKAEATRARQVAAADLGAPPAGNAPRAPAIVSAEDAVAAAARAAGTDSPAQAGAEYTWKGPPTGMRVEPARPIPVPRVATVLDQATPAPSRPAPKPATPKPTPPKPAPKPAPAATAPAPATTGATGGWRVQLGAFGVPGNAQKLWDKVKNRPELAGHARMLVPAGRLTKLQAGGFPSQSAAEAACGKLRAGGITCIAARD
ncbi:SPOR domain-containing protein [Novosphingobium sp. H3SJ31-1]|uniref:SPOR domain-containing protein n=2 Tax=Novosphingobium album (ex Liu et al. 2023) TaxID=3031130 RepID=A0ABT5WRL1_9SPHN|nr:SPOR domain-containing protein [Novosphingobium album (ex Liu et al. 2023)]MDE8652675.1 SPOR domain-containing protein [Novosphingobium album (ex Liu et al. 2023)]